MVEYVLQYTVLLRATQRSFFTLKSCSFIPQIRATGQSGDPVVLTTNEEKGVEFHRTFFLPPTAAPPPATPYPPPKFKFRPITNHQVAAAIGALKAFKAPGPDGIPNEVYKHCADLLTPRLGQLFRATFELDYYPEQWKISDTVVLKKPGKTDYTVAKAWRPIALLSCMSKILSRCVADVLVYEAERLSLLANFQFGGRAGRTTTDSIHLVTKTVKDAWRKGHVASVVFLDIKSAFPAASPHRLIHNLRMRGVPSEYTDWLAGKLSGRRTRLRFDDHTSTPFAILNGIDQGCPLSVILYAFYNSDLIDSARKAAGETAVGSMDDVALVATGKTFADCHRGVRRFMDRPGGALEWSRTHGSEFSLDKFGLINCKARAATLGPALKLSDGTSIPPSDHHRFLGVLLDNRLKFTQHVDLALAKGMRWVSLIGRLARARNGLAPAVLRRLYLTVAVPGMLYAADTFLTPVRKLAGKARRHGSVGHLRRLARVQRQALIAITEALRSTATDVMEAHANLLPFELLVDRLCHRAAVRLCTLPNSHPLAPHVRKAGKRLVKTHRSSLHELLDAYRRHLRYRNTERIAPARLHPQWRPAHRTHAIKDREAAIADDDRWARHGAYRVYSDGSDFQGGVGAAAVLYAPGRRRPRVLHYHLGPSTDHTVYEAEVVGTLLALELLRTEPRLSRKASIALDNTAVIQASTLSSAAPGRYLVDHFHRSLRSLRQQRPDLRLTLRWSPGHDGIPGNEKADEEAKAAARGRTSPKSDLPKALQRQLPLSASSLRRNYAQQLKQKAATIWKSSARGQRMEEVAGRLPSNHYLDLVRALPRRHAGLLMQLRTGHIPLQAYLARIGKALSRTCPTCGEAPETVHHYLIECPTYNLHRAVHFAKLGRAGRTLRKLLATEDALRPLFRFVNATGRFRQVFGALDDVPRQEG